MSTLEENIFKRYTLKEDALVPYGFVREGDIFTYTQDILDGAFKVQVCVEHMASICCKVTDTTFDEEYVNFRIKEQNGEFVNKVRDAITNILEDIRAHCYAKEYFLLPQANRITYAIQELYDDEPEYVFSKFPSIGVFRNPNNKKWYGIIINVKKSKLNKSVPDIETEVLNVKLDEHKIADLVNKDGYYKAYHMNKKSWISIILDGTISDEEILALIKESHAYTL